MRLIKPQPNKKLTFIILGILALVNFFVWLIVLNVSRDELFVYFFDVGQGDAIYLRTPANQDVIIDGGPDNTVLTKLGEVMPFYDRKIELMILTHPHADHLTGLVEILQRYQVEQILYSGVVDETLAYQYWEKISQDHHLAMKIALAGQTVELGEARIDILFPEDNLLGKTANNLNNTSVVGRLVFGKNSFLLMGDAEKEVEKILLSKPTSWQLQSSVLKTGHHGSRTSSTPEFLSLVNPEIAVISVGENNRYQHPAPSTLQNLADLGIKYFRTDQDGDIKCWSDGEIFNCKAGI